MNIGFCFDKSNLFEASPCITDAWVVYVLDKTFSPTARPMLTF